MTRQRAKVKALEEASDMNARALTALAVASSNSSSISVNSVNCASDSIKCTPTQVSTSSTVNVQLVTSSSIANAPSIAMSNRNASVASPIVSSICHRLPGQGISINQSNEQLMKSARSVTTATLLTSTGQSIGNSTHSKSNLVTSIDTNVSTASNNIKSICSDGYTFSSNKSNVNNLQVIKRCSNNTCAPNKSGPSTSRPVQLLQLTNQSNLGKNTNNGKSVLSINCNSSHRVSPVTTNNVTKNVSTSKGAASPTSLIFNLSHLQNGNGILILPSLNQQQVSAASTSVSSSPVVTNCSGNMRSNNNHSNNTSTNTPVTLLYSRNTSSVNSCDSLESSKVISIDGNCNKNTISNANDHISLDMFHSQLVNNNFPRRCDNNNTSQNENTFRSNECDMEISIEMNSNDLSHLNVSPETSPSNSTVVTGRNVNLQSTSSVNSSSPPVGSNDNNETNIVCTSVTHLADVDACDLSHFASFTDASNGNSGSNESVSRFTFNQNSPHTHNNSRIVNVTDGNCNVNSLNSVVETTDSTNQLQDREMHDITVSVNNFTGHSCVSSTCNCSTSSSSSSSHVLNTLYNSSACDSIGQVKSLECHAIDIKSVNRDSCRKKLFTYEY